MKASKELKLALVLIQSGRELPGKLKKQVLEELELMIATTGEGEAEYYVFEELIKAIENESIEAIDLVTNMIECIYGDEEKQDSHVSEETEEAMTAMINEVVDRFTKIDDEPLMMKILETITKQLGALPLLFEQGLLCCYMHSNHIMVFCVNENLTKAQAFDRYSSLNGKAKMIDMISEYNGRQDCEIKFMKLSYRKFEDGKCELATIPL